jgi:hypothetical protein
LTSVSRCDSWSKSMSSIVLKLTLPLPAGTSRRGAHPTMQTCQS